MTSFTYGDVTGGHPVKRIVCRVTNHVWRSDGPIYSDGWVRRCEKCGAKQPVTR